MKREFFKERAYDRRYYGIAGRSIPVFPFSAQLARGRGPGRPGFRLTLAGALCLTGGMAGILLGCGLSPAESAVLHWPILPSVPANVAVVAVSGTVGIIFGFYSAWKAARLDPIEALRYE